MDLNEYVRSIPDFPQPGIVFKDITPILGNPRAFKYTVDSLADRFESSGATKVCAAEARGFMFAAALAYRLDWGIVPIRKPGKLPWKTISQSYQLEYGEAILLMHQDAVKPGEKVLLVDDLLATGGTAESMVKLVERLGGEIAGLGFVIELDFLHGRDMLRGRRVESLMHVAGERP
ncbi:MAG: adenine phosphoribosyltransferase [Planctomycetota bacterium]|jgi:adenine phosphoribosyltransferase|nr:adenine phosphoribosyltransferase [Planctomycetota bacterium]